MISIRSLLHDSSLAISVLFCVHSCSVCYRGILFMTAGLSSAFRNCQFSPLSPPLRFLSFLKACRHVWRALCSSSLAPVLSQCLHSLCSHTLVSDGFSSPAPAWPFLSPAGAAAALLCSHQDLRKGNMTKKITKNSSYLFVADIQKNL